MSRPRFALIPAAYVYLRRGDEVLLQLRQGTGYLDGTWAAGAAGHIEFGEHATMAAIREAREELGITLEEHDLTPLSVMQRTDGTPTEIEQRVDWFFATSTWVGNPRIMEPSKCARIDWFSLQDIPEAMPPHERLILESLADDSLVAFTSFGF